MNDRRSKEPQETSGNSSDYTLDFEPISNKKGSVRFVDAPKGKERTVGLAVNDEEFGHRVPGDFPAIVADMIDLAVAIHASDRLASQNFRGQERRLHVTLPIRHPELLSASSIQDKLTKLLYWATGSKWFFDFKRREVPRRMVEQQTVLPVIAPVSEVNLWSGGLDSLAGLYNRLREYPEQSFALVGIGISDLVYNRQKRVAQAVQSILANRCNLVRLRISFNNSGSQPKNRFSRARGVVFMLLGAAYAYLMDRRELYLYENGIGAINLPYRASELGLDRSRSVHPLTLLMVGDLVSEVLGEKFRVRNPFLFWTKAEMCAVFAEEKKNNLPPLTMSCDRPQHQRPSACGYCSSCLLRRQALAAASIKDKTRYVIIDGKRPATDPSLHFHAMRFQVHTLSNLLNTSEEFNLQWEALTREFLALDDVVDRCAAAEGMLPTEMQKSLLGLYSTYVSEWETVEKSISTGLLDKCGNQQASLDGLAAATKPC